MPHDGPFLTGGPPSPQTAAQFPDHGFSGVTWGYVSSRSVVGTTYANAADGIGTASSTDGGGAYVGNFSGDSYTQDLWTIPLSVLRGQMSDIPPDLAAAIAADPRLHTYTWDTPATVLSARWAPYLGSKVTGSGAGTDTTHLAAKIAHPFVFAYYTGAVDVSTGHAHTAAFVPRASLPAGWSWVQDVSEFFLEDVFGGEEAWARFNNFLPDLAAGDGVEVPVADFASLDDAYALVYPGWQTVPDGFTDTSFGSGIGAYRLTYAIGVLAPEAFLRAEWDTDGTYHYTYYDPPTAPEPAALDAFGGVAWAPSVIDMPSGNLGWHIKLIDDDTNTVVFEYDVFPSPRTFTIPFGDILTLTLSHFFKVSVAAKDSVGVGDYATSGLTHLIGADPTPDLTGTPGDTRIHFVD